MRGLFATGSDHWVKTVGVYIILILAVLRFLIVPLHGAVKDRRAILADRQETYQLKSRMLQQARQLRNDGALQDRGRASTDLLYPRETRVSTIQAEILAALSQYSEGNGLAVQGFEMPEAVIGKAISEVNVVFRLTGGVDSFVEWLKAIRDHQKNLAVKAMEISVSGQTMTFSVTAGAFRVER